MTENLKPRAITPMKQNLESGCVPTSISMVLSGFGIDISEQALVDRYFPTAGLPISAWDREKGVIPGVTNTGTVKGIVQIINGLGLREQLQLDVFLSYLDRYTNSSEKKYIVRAEPNTLRKYGRQFEKGDEWREFHETLEQLLKSGEIGVYTANARMLGLKKEADISSFIPPDTIRGFYGELIDFVKKGHIVGPHGGMTMHTRALDGSRMEKLEYHPYEVRDAEGFRIVDPRGDSYTVSPSSLVWLDSWGVRGDTFDYLFRIAPRENELKPQTYGFRRFLQNLRNLIP